MDQSGEAAARGAPSAQAGATAAGNPAPAATDWAILAVLVVIWGSAFAAIRVSIETVGPFWMVVGRLTVASVLLGLILVVSGWMRIGPRALRAAAHPSPPGWKGLGAYVLVGIPFTGIPFFFYAKAGETLSSAVLAICNGGVPLFTAVFAHLMLTGEKLTLRRGVGVLLGFGGLAVLVAPSLAGGATASLLGLALAIFGASLYSGGNIATRRAPPVSPVVSSFIITVSGGLFILPFALALEPFPAAPSIPALLGVLYLGAGPTAIGTILYVILIKRAGAVFVAMATYMTPLWAAFLGVTFLGEPLLPTTIAALALILAGVAIASNRRRARAG